MTFYYWLHKAYKLNFVFIMFFPILILLSFRRSKRNPFTGIWQPMTNIFVVTADTMFGQIHLFSHSY